MTGQRPDEEGIKRLWKSRQDDEKKRAEDMPRTRDVLRQVGNAKFRMRDLGWSRGLSSEIMPGEACALADLDWMVIWRAQVSDDGESILYPFAASDPELCWLKPISKLSEDERFIMEDCDEWYRRNLDQKVVGLLDGLLSRREE